MAYSQALIERFRNPKNVGEIADANGIGRVGNASCGDIMEIYLKIENNIVVDAKFKTFGCASAIASSDVACDLIRGRTVEDALKLTNDEIVKELDGLPAQKIHCSILASEAIALAVEYYRNGGKMPTEDKMV
ncbi:MAG: iron-sulfur cluster assembly scaffold protein [Clostridia bacterium]|nr:iron-sulfur cluster assembly scaffold protein [Clostridia bacterium]